MSALVLVLAITLFVLALRVGSARAAEVAGSGSLTHAEPPDRDRERQLAELRALPRSTADVRA